MASYIIKVQIVFTVLFIAYYSLFRKEKFLVLNRFVLIGVLVAAFALPVLPALNSSRLAVSPLDQQINLGNAYPQFILNDQSSKALVRMSESLRRVNYETLAVNGYFMVTCFLIVLFLTNLYKIFSVIRASRRRKVNGLIFCEPFHETAPFSFFNFIVIAERSFNTDECRQIIAHENAHSRQLHSIDALLADIACFILWINPLIYLYRRQLKLNLEFLADKAALSTGIDARDYQLNLLRHSGVLTAYPPVNAFFTSKIKERIITINTTQPGISNSYKYFLLPMLMLTLSALVGFQKIAPAIIPPPSKSAASSVSIDARTDTVKFSLVRDSADRRFKGIYVIEDKILTDDEIREKIQSHGRLEMKLASRPIIGTYSANDSSAIKKWGEQARYGVVFVKSRPEKPDQ